MPNRDPATGRFIHVPPSAAQIEHLRKVLKRANRKLAGEEWLYGVLAWSKPSGAVFAVRGRPGYVYVRVKTGAVQTTAPARNDANVAWIENLPVRMYMDGTDLVIESIDRRPGVAVVPPSDPNGVPTHTHDARYFRETEHIVASAGAADAGKPVITAALTGKLDPTLFDTAGNVGAAIHAAPVKATPVGADEVGYLNSAAAFALVRATWTDLLAWLTTLFVDRTTAQTIAGAKIFSTSPLTAGDGTGQAFVAIDGAAGVARQLGFYTAGVLRWLFQVTATAESGSNAGSNWALLARDDAGASLSVPLVLERATGNVIFGSLTAAITTVARMLIIQPTLGGIVQRWRTTATNDDVTLDIVQNRIATTNATPTTLHTFAIAAGFTYLISVEVIARRTGGAAGTADDGAAYIKTAAYTTKAGVVTLMTGGVVQNIDREDVAGWDCQLVISGTNVIVQVTGAASTNITWHLVSGRVAGVGT